jgi:hypothetical protein
MEIDMEKILSRKISVKELVKLASDLKSDGENPEYERALCELVTDAAGLSMDYKERIAREIGLKADIR